MRIVFFDDSLPFDGSTPDNRPLGGAEKALAALPGALATRGHDVIVYNRTPDAVPVGGVRWQPLSGPKVTSADVMVAFRRPGLLDESMSAGRRLLWATAHPSYLHTEAADALLIRHGAAILFSSDAQRAAYGGQRPNLVIPPGLRMPYLAALEREEAPAPVALTTVHPGPELEWLIAVWTELIHPQLPQARLKVFSALLARAQRGEAIPEALHGLYAQARLAQAKGVEICDPQGDRRMAEEYRAARVHLYVPPMEDLINWTLMESQSCGLPAVALARGSVEERIVNGQTGYVVPDADAFANVAAQILSDDAVHASLSEAAGDLSRKRTWDQVAGQMERLLGFEDEAAPLPGAEA
ncbi:glycosyltransferase [Novispirillum itersonii]|uniref:glycosyltransferase n=1 Tax=Novispirillum itersonii TaxID=189 RepID=UPI000370F229|nr:glycosyltransferase [Novispirillum itersonii]